MKIAIPVVEDMLAPRFGHCTSFAFFDVDAEKKEVLARQDMPAPPHRPDYFPNWLAECGIRLVIASGMGKRALALLRQKQIAAIVGAEIGVPEHLVGAYLNGQVESGENLCDGCYTVKIKLPAKPQA
ncbi:MAG: Dinitrogenase iron-molybdenum cofactor biosynthesis [Burkholderiaceae bacterium]|nr:Dinitrogenase iron-molybdenum cofactor biosynthesis [Burkholderiaceae bacterium]